MDEDYRTYAPHERPDVEVLVDGNWCPGELRAWHLRDDVWLANVVYRTSPGEQYAGVFPTDRVREV